MLEDYIRQEIEKPFEWKVTDCCSTANRWVFLKTGISPISLSGFDFETEEEAKSILKKNRNLLVACRKAMTMFEKTKEPQEGDIGIIRIYEDTICAAIRMKNGWFTRNENGIISFETTPIIAWSICLKQSH